MSGPRTIEVGGVPVLIHQGSPGAQAALFLPSRALVSRLCAGEEIEVPAERASWTARASIIPGDPAIPTGLYRVGLP